jgi:hypothetical protein
MARAGEIIQIRPDWYRNRRAAAPLPALIGRQVLHTARQKCMRLAGSAPDERAGRLLHMVSAPAPVNIKRLLQAAQPPEKQLYALQAPHFPQQAGDCRNNAVLP